MAIILRTCDAGFESAFTALLAAKRESAADVDDTVARDHRGRRGARRRGADRIHKPVRPRSS